MMRGRRRMILASLAVILLILAGYYGFDRPVATFFTQWDGPVVTVFQMITYLGVSTGYLVGSAVLFLYFYYGSARRIWAQRMGYIFVAVAASGGVTNLVKWMMGRWRPNVLASEGLYGFEFFGAGYEQTSFPSGHATTICALAVTLCALFPRFRWIWVVLALLVSVSRMVIGAHYASDVIAGAYIGIFISILLRKWPQFGIGVWKGRSD